MKTTINVTQEHIYAGIRYDCKNCPVALAFLDTFPWLKEHKIYNPNNGEGFPAYSVNGESFNIINDGDGDDDYAFQFFLPEEVQRWIRLFDRCPTLVVPISFEFETDNENFIRWNNQQKVD